MTDQTQESVESMRTQVTLALGLSLAPDSAPQFAWSYLLDSIRELVKCEEELVLLKAGQVMSKSAPCLHQIKEPATGLQQLIAEIDQHMRTEWNAGRLPAESWPTALASRVSAAVAGSAATVHAAMPTQHPDDAAVDALAALMKAKLAKQRDKGYGGWDTDCTRERLSELLLNHVDKGDPVDVANFCAFLSARSEGIAPQAQADARDAESDYQRGYRHGYNRRDAEVQGAFL